MPPFDRGPQGTFVVRKMDRRLIRVLASNSHNPFFNLALESELLAHVSQTTYAVFLWRNRPCVVIGKFQNPYKECRLALMHREGVALARRQSGGGSVYHDLGNTNVSVLTPRSTFDKRNTNDILLKGLANCGITATQSKRGDLVVESEAISSPNQPSAIGVQFSKFSGAAFKLSRTAALQHNTLLINADLSRLKRYLSPTRTLAECKGVESVPSPVINLQTMNPSITHQHISNALSTVFPEAWDAGVVSSEVWDEHGVVSRTIVGDQGAVGDISGDDDAFLARVRNTEGKLQSWEWMFGLTPPFRNEFTVLDRDGSPIALSLRAKHGKIVNVECSAHYPLSTLLEEHLVNREYSSEGISDAVSDIRTLYPDVDAPPDLVQQINTHL